MACCQGANCNSATPVLSCMVGTSGTGTATACTNVNQLYCKTDISGGSVVKNCASTCAASSTVACCSNAANCNTATPVLSCMVGTGAGTATTCSVNALYCQTDISTGQVVQSCANTCSAGTSTACCAAANCNTNVPVISCYVGSSGNGTVTACDVTKNFCAVSQTIIIYS